MIKINSEDLKLLMKQSHNYNVERTIIKMIKYYRSMDKEKALEDWYNFMTMYHPPLTLFLSINLLIENPKFEYEINVTNEKSRCCGRCDGYNDICVADEICDDHNERGCEICFGKR